MRKNLCLCVILFLLTGCNSKFDRQKWMIQEDVEYYPYRKSMVNDLMKNHHFQGLSYWQLTDSLGKPDGNYSPNEISYLIDIKYDMIDPVYFKNLVFRFNKDSVVTGCEVKEWKK